MFAALNIHKPLGLTSHDVVARLRRVYGLKKIGHLGTLDPMAEGVLPVCMGQATRLIEYFPTDKRYTAQVTLGITTTTLDREGEELSRTDCRDLDLSEAALEPVLKTWTGTIRQQVPLYSAVHVGGKKLYKIARAQGEAAQAVELPTRQVTIHELTLLRVNTTDPAHPVLHLDVHCSSGTYIRSLARDIGDALHCGAHLSGLVRTRHGLFDLTDSIPLEALQESPNPRQFLLDPTAYLQLEHIQLISDAQARQLAQGMPIDPPEGSGPLKPNRPYLAQFQDAPVGIVEFARHRLKPVKIFNLSPLSS